MYIYKYIYICTVVYTHKLHNSLSCLAELKSPAEVCIVCCKSNCKYIQLWCAFADETCETEHKPCSVFFLIFRVKLWSKCGSNNHAKTIDVLIQKNMTHIITIQSSCIAATATIRAAHRNMESIQFQRHTQRTVLQGRWCHPDSLSRL